MWPADDRRGRLSCLLALVLITYAGSAGAHAGSVAFWRVIVESTSVRSEILLSLEDVAPLASHVPPDAGDVPLARLGDLRAVVPSHFLVLEDGIPVESRVVAARMLPSGLLEVDVEHRLSASGRSLALRSSFHTLTDEAHRVIVRVGRDGASAALVLTADAPEHVIGPGVGRHRPAVGPAAMVRLGIAHILTGYDHLVFLLCLLVAGGTWRSRAAVVSAFTLAHSTTLVLAAMGVVTPPARFVEPAIALSIAYVAVENLLAGRTTGAGARWPTAFIFGLVHGLGFAGMLGVLDLPLREWLVSVLCFNLGVEAGQLAVVAVAVPCMAWLSATRWHWRVVQSTSVLVLGLAFVWFVERLS